jgi:hypothetical protein
MSVYDRVVVAAGRIERVGNISFEPLSFSMSAGQRQIVRRGATSWPFIVLGMTGECRDATGVDASPLVLVRLRDASSEQPYTAHEISLYSLVGPSSRPTPMRLIKPFLLTRERRIEIELNNTSAQSVSGTITLWGVRHYGDPLSVKLGD